MKIRIASHNEVKLKEFKAIFEPFGYEVLMGLDDMSMIEETGDTFTENAFIKAEAIHAITGDLVIADDSGLCIDALPDILGVKSARFMEELSYLEKNKLLLEMLSDEENRKASFHSVIALVGKGTHESFAGRIDGEISREIMGAEGFGYDPIFVTNGYTESFGTMGPELKNQISHRALALEKLMAYLETHQV